MPVLYIPSSVLNLIRENKHPWKLIARESSRSSSWRTEGGSFDPPMSGDEAKSLWNANWWWCSMLPRFVACSAEGLMDNVHAFSKPPRIWEQEAEFLLEKKPCRHRGGTPQPRRAVYWPRFSLRLITSLITRSWWRLFTCSLAASASLLGWSHTLNRKGSSYTVFEPPTLTNPLYCHARDFS